MRVAVARNPSTAPAALGLLALSRDDWIRRIAADNPNTPVEALRRYWNNDDQKGNEASGSLLTLKGILRICRKYLVDEV